MNGEKPIDLAAWRALDQARRTNHPCAYPRDPDESGPIPPDDAELADLIEQVQGGVAERRWHAAIPQRFHRATLDDWIGASFHGRIADWSTDERGRNVVLAGATGVGKTHLAVAACRFAHFAGLEVRLVGIVRLLDLLRPGGEPDTLDDLVDVDRLIVDDLGSEKPSDWTMERLSALIDARWSEERPTVCTTNLSSADLRTHLGPYSFSRLAGDDSIRLRLSGDDRRRP